MILYSMMMHVASGAPTVRVNSTDLETAAKDAPEVCFPGETRSRLKTPTDPIINQVFMEGGRINCFARETYVSFLVCFDLDVDLEAMPEKATCSVGGRSYDVRLERVSADSGPWRVWTPDEDAEE
ncbi:MAG: hypothetical protein H6735_05525 [Alphaproteobacteria bacterium]|nr:hypothetical protein [Alphaproteobacteria bacterium]